MSISSIPSSPSSFYAISDDGDDGYNAIGHRPNPQSSGRGVRLLFTKSKVYIHPTAHSRDNIVGFIALIQKIPGGSGSSVTDIRCKLNGEDRIPTSQLMLSWVPQSMLSPSSLDTYVKVDLSESLSPKQSYLVPRPIDGPSKSSGVKSEAYSFSISLSEIYSIHLRSPSIGWWFGSVIVTSRSGVSYPALFFHDSECESTIKQRKRLAKDNFDPFGDDGRSYWGGSEVLRWLKQYVRVERSNDNSSVYLIEPSTSCVRMIADGSLSGTRGQSRMNSVTKDDAGIVSSGMQPRQTAILDTGIVTTNMNSYTNTTTNSNTSVDMLTKALREARWNVLEKLSQVTTFTRRTAQAVVENPNLPPHIKRFLGNPDVVNIQNEFDSARLYLARWAMGVSERDNRETLRFPSRELLDTEETELGLFEILDLDLHDYYKALRKSVNDEEWNSWFDEEGRLTARKEYVKERIFYGGLGDDQVRREAWPFLLEFYAWDSSRIERRDLLEKKREEFIRLKSNWWLRMTELKDISVNNQETVDINDKMATLRVTTPVSDASVQNTTVIPDETAKINETNSNSFVKLSPTSKPKSEDNSQSQTCHIHDWAWWKEQKNRIEKDVHRTDRHISLFADDNLPHPDPSSTFCDVNTNAHLEQLKHILLTYNEFNPKLGYVQGMSDLLSPLYAICQDDALTFWTFVNFMNRMERNFVRDQSGMRLQLVMLDHLVSCLDPTMYMHLQKLECTNFFFFFRMLLVWFKREFPWDDILRLWETLWTDHLSSNFHIFVAFAILEKHRELILTYLRGFDEVLKFINELSHCLDLEDILIRAEALYYRLKKTISLMDRIDPPSKSLSSSEHICKENSDLSGVKYTVSSSSEDLNCEPEIIQKPDKPLCNIASNIQRQDDSTIVRVSKCSRVSDELWSLLRRDPVTSSSFECKKYAQRSEGA